MTATPPRPPAARFPNPLDVKWQSQNDNASGRGYRECFSSSCAMLAMFHGKIANDDAYNRIRRQFGDTTDVTAQLGTLHYLGLTVNFTKHGKLADLEAEINAGRPVAVGWLHEGPVSAPIGGGHWSVIVGYTATHWIHNDPNGEALLVRGGYTRNRNGHRLMYSRKNWNPRWQEGGEAWMLTCKP